MESDDDYDSFPPLSSPSPPVHHRRLQRLKKAVKPPDSTPPIESPEDLLSIPRVDFAKLEALEASKALGSGEDSGDLLPIPKVDFAKLEALEALGGSKTLDSSEPLLSRSVDNEAELNAGLSEEGGGISGDAGSFDGENCVDSFGEKRKEAKRVLEFEEVVNEPEASEDLELKKPEKKRINEGDLDEENVEGTEKKKKKKKKKKTSKADDDDSEMKVNKRKEEKDRKAYLKQLHADTQRVLREARDVTFRPVPVVHKPISSVLEKIRQRKLEVLKKTTMLSNSYVSEKTSALREVMMDLDSDDVDIEEIEVQKSSKTVEDERIEPGMDVESSIGASPVDGSKETAMHISHETVPTQKVLDEESTPAFRAPVDNTQGLFADSQESNSKDENNQLDSPMEEAFAPSLLAMKLKFDSAAPEDSSSEEEDNDKENIDPHEHKDLDDCNSPKGDPVKAFVDEEAEEEEDSDNDIGFLKENEEDEENDDSEELNDIIATECEERPIDNEKRNELHQKWLEQQDAAGTDNLLQRLKYNAKYTETTLPDEAGSDNEDEEESDDEVENEVPRNTARMTSKRAKQMIVRMFSDKDDTFVSDEEDETEKRLVKQRLLFRSEEHGTLISPAEDESSREVFGLIKKLNIAPDHKKKPKASSFFDTMLRGSANISSKSSFLGRISNHPLQSSHKQGAGVVRSFVFGRDDSNSRSSISISEDSSDPISQDNRPSKSTTAKFSCSQARSSSQRSSSSGEAVAGSSLLEILKRSSAQSGFCKQNNKVDISHSVFNAFKIPKKPVKIEGRS